MKRKMIDYHYCLVMVVDWCKILGLYYRLIIRASVNFPYLYACLIASSSSTSFYHFIYCSFFSFFRMCKITLKILIFNFAQRTGRFNSAENFSRSQDRREEIVRGRGEKPDESVQISVDKRKQKKKERKERLPIAQFSELTAESSDW